MSSRYWIIAALIAAPVLSHAQDAVFSESMVEGLHGELAPALGLVSYSYRSTNPATGQVSTSSSFALGVVVSEDGIVMARGHMATENVEPYNIRVKLGEDANERLYDAELARKPDDVNVVFLEIEPDEPLPYVRFDDTSNLRMGEPVLVFGMMGQAFDNVPAVNVRRIGAVIDKPRTTYVLDDPVPVGYVGGPVVNRRGNIVGVVGYDLSPGEGGDLYVRSGHPLVYQSGLFQAYVADPHRASPEDARPDGWLGVFTQPLTDDLAEYWDMPRDGGIVVSTIVQGSPAQQAGLRRGDVIVSFNEVPVRARQDREVLGFTKLVREAPVGEAIPVRVLRDGQPVELTLTLIERPRTARDAEEHEDETFGLTVQEITTDMRIALNLPQDVQGVIVRRVRSGSWAQLAQIGPGVIIMSFGERPVTNLDDFREAVEQVKEEQPSEVAVFGRAGQVTGFFRIEPRW